MLDGNYLLDAGAERLTLEWKLSVGKLIDKRDGVETKDEMSAALTDLFYKAGSSKYVPQELPDNLSMFERGLLSSTLAPIESDGPEDMEEWNLFDEYLVVKDDQKILEQRHTLAITLSLWRQHVVSSCNPLLDPG